MSFLQKVRRARKFYPLASPKQATHQAIKWALSVETLGDKWLLHKKSQKLAELRPV